jgi:CRISPR-associated endonuclease Csy4
MESYVEIQLLHDPEFAPPVLMSRLFQNLHLQLATKKAKDIGVSFPDVDSDCPGLGSTIRIHGTEAGIMEVMEASWLKRMTDYVEVGALRRVPDKCRYRNVRRAQAKSNPDRLRRRMMRRKGVSYEEARLAIPDAAEERLGLPYLMLRSGSTGHRFRLFIAHGSVQDDAVPGEFNSYGLSPTATIPWF